MAVIYLRHARHGTKVACSDLEAAADEKVGWSRFDPTLPTATVPLEAPGPLPEMPAFLTNLGVGSESGENRLADLAPAARGGSRKKH